MPKDDDKRHSEQFLIPINTIRNSSTIQSHLLTVPLPNANSTTTSLKRLRISPSWYPSFPKDRIHSSAGMSGQQHSQRTKKTDVRTFQEIGGGHRLDRKLIARYALIAYCFLSCIIATYRLYSFFRVNAHSLPEPQRRAAAVGQIPTMEMGVMTNYLLKALPCTTAFEPFVLSNNNDHKNGEVSFVGWLNESMVDSIRTWSALWPGPLSVLVTTAALPGSPSHSELLRKIKTYSGITGLSIHLLFVQPHFSTPTPNLYMNLARLMAPTNWTLLFPGDTSHHPTTPYNLHQSVTQLNLENVQDPFVFTFGSNFYPFPSLSPVLISRAHSFWCTERMFLNVSRMSDWDECLWQIALETFGKSVTLNAATSRSVKGRLSSTPKGWTRQRLSARFRAEMCEIVSKNIAAVYPRNRQRVLKVQWVKDFCAKTIDKKLTI